MPGAQVLLLREDAALFQRRADSGEWKIPAGSAEPGQSFVQAAISEVYEEIGLTVRSEDMVPFATFSDPKEHRLVYPNGDVVHAFALCFVAASWEGDSAPRAEEVTEWGSYPLSAPPTPLRPSTRRVLELYAEFLRTGRSQAA